jgi:hypothetical protein
MQFLTVLVLDCRTTIAPLRFVGESRPGALGLLLHISVDQRLPDRPVQLPANRAFAIFDRNPAAQTPQSRCATSNRRRRC